MESNKKINTHGGITATEGQLEMKIVTLSAKTSLMLEGDKAGFRREGHNL